MLRTRLLALLAALVPLVPACGAEPGAEGAVRQWDSAGVRMTLSPDAPRTFAEVDPAPLLDLGGADARGPTQFSNVRGILVDAGGNLWVADGTSAEIRLFRPDGSAWKTLGGRGEGPGEFRRPRLLGIFGGDSVAAWDDGVPRLSVYDARGTLVRTASLARGDEIVPQAYRVHPDGSLLVRVPRIYAAGALEPGTVLGDSAELLRLDPRTLERRGLAVLPDARWLWTGRHQVPLPFSVAPPFDLAGDRLLTAAGPDFRLRVHGPRGLERVGGIERPPVAADRRQVARYRAFVEGMLPDSALRAAYLSALESPERPELLPAYDRLLSAPGGSAWAERYDADPLGARAWDVYDADGAWRGSVEMPAGFQLEAVQGEHLVGVWRDELGVEHVRVYRLGPPGP